MHKLNLDSMFEYERFLALIEQAKAEPIRECDNCAHQHRGCLDWDRSFTCDQCEWKPSTGHSMWLAKEMGK